MAGEELKKGYGVKIFDENIHLVKISFFLAGNFTRYLC